MVITTLETIHRLLKAERAEAKEALTGLLTNGKGTRRKGLCR